MRRPVRIVRQPRAQSGFEIKMNPGMGFNANQLSWPVMAGEFSAPEIETKRTLQPTDWDQANLEAEKGETVVTDLTQDGIPQHYTIGGKRHYEGGTPLNLPPNSFIFSRDKSMRIKDEEILKMFNMTPTKKGYAPADIAKQYDINKYRKILADPDSEDLQRETAEMMIANYNLKLGKLALVQESLKGFPQGVPMIAMPYLQTMGMNPEEFAQTQGQQDQPEEGTEQARYGGRPRNLPKHQFGPSQNNNPMADTDGNGLPDYLQTNLNPEGTSPGLNTTGGSGSITVKRKGLGNLFDNPTKVAELGIAGGYGLANIFNAPERADAEADLARRRSSNNLFQHVGGQDLGDYMVDNSAGAHFRPNQTGQQFLSDRAVGNMPGYNAGFSQYGGEEGSLPKAQFGNFGMFGNIGGSGFFGPRSKMVGMRFNPSTGVYEAVNRRGEVIGFFRAGQGQGGFGTVRYPGTTTTAGGTTTTGEETTTTIKKKKVKKQVIPEGATVVKRSDYDTDAEYEAARDKAFAETGGKKKVYTQDKDGKYYTVGEGPMFEKGDTQGMLAYLKERFTDPKVMELLKGEIVKASKDPKKLKRGLTAAEVENMKPEDLAKEFLEFNERNLKVNDLIKGGYSCFDNSGKFVGDPNNPTCKELAKKYDKKSLKDVYKDAGLEMDWEKDKKKAALQQLTYLGYENLLGDLKAGKITDEDVKKKLENFKIAQLGVSDEDIGKGQGKLSPADTAYTNTTAGQVAGITGTKRKEDLLEETEVEEEEKAEKKKKGISPYFQSNKAPWWLQDIVKSGNAFADYATVKKYMPWAPTPNLTLPEATYYDPNRQLAANAEGAANLIQNLAAFQGPQALSSRASQIFGQTAKGAADILGQYNNMNVGIANNMALQRANLLNQDAVRRTGIAKQLYDENTVANQQFDNAKRQARHNMVNQWVSGKTNAMNTYNLNQLYPQYQVHPEWGGPITFEGGRDVNADISGKDNYMSKFKDYKKQLPAGTSDDVIWNLVKGDISGTASSSVDPEYMKAWQATMQGMNSGNV